MRPFSNISCAWHRLRIRKLYNSSRWDEARILSLPHLSCNINGEFAQDIVIRSLWNLHRYEEVIAFALTYPSENAREFSEKSKQRMGLGIDPLPSIHKTTEWNSEDLLANWFQEDDTVWLRHPWGWTHWVMPNGYDLRNTHPSLLELAMYVLLKPWTPEMGQIMTKNRPFGKKLALSYSGGTDSAAAGILLPDDTILSYHERSFFSMLNHDLPNHLFEQLHKKNGRDVLRIPSNHERIRTFHGKPNGFSTDYAAGSHLILLADHLDLKGIAFGTPIDNTWLEKGRRFRDFSQSWHWEHWRERFAHAGLHLELPINHISEAGALRICQQSNLADDINSCLRSIDGEGCQKCWKCFHKNGPLGRPMNPESAEIQKFLNTRPLRTAQHALWAIQIQNLEKMVPHLSAELANSLEWWERAYPPGIELISEPWKTTVKKRTEQMIPYMERPELLEEVDLFPDSWE